MRKLWLLFAFMIAGACVSHAQAPPQANVLTYCTATNGTVAICPSGTAGATTNLYPQGSVVTYCLSTQGTIVPCPPGGGGSSSFPANTSNPSSTYGTALEPNQSISFYGGSWGPRAPQVVSGSNIFFFGDSNCVGAGAVAIAGNPATNYSFPHLNSIAIGSGTSTNNCASGSYSADIVDEQLFKSGGSSGTDVFPNYGGSLTFLHTLTNDANQTASTNANVQTDTARIKTVEVVATALASNQWVMATSPQSSCSGTFSTGYYWISFPNISLTAAASYCTLTVTTYGHAVYLFYPVYNNDTGTFTVSENSTNLTDTITGLTSIPNAPLNGTFQVLSPYTQVPMAARFIPASLGTPTSPVTHTFTVTCTAPGNNGCGLFAMLSAPNNNQSFLPNFVSVDNVMPQQTSAKDAISATYSAIATTVASTAYNDGLPVYLNDIRTPLLANRTAAYSSTDGMTNGGLQLTDITITAGQTSACSASHFFTVADLPVSGQPKEFFLENAVTSTTTLYTTITSLASSTITPPVATYTSNCVNLATAPTLGFTGNGVAYVGYDNQIFPGSASPGLHINNLGQRIISNTQLGILQAVTAPLPQITPMTCVAGSNCSIKTASAQSFNINTSSLTSSQTTGVLTSPRLEVFGNGTSTSYSIAEWQDATNATPALSLFTTGTDIQLCPAVNVFNLTGGVCAYKYLTTGAQFAHPLTVTGSVTDTGETINGHLNQNASTNFAGSVVISAGTTGSLTFTTAYTSTPVCTVSPENTSGLAGLTYSYTKSTTSVAITLSASGTETFDVICVGNPN